jgi:hypothetical protein
MQTQPQEFANQPVPQHITPVMSQNNVLTFAQINPKRPTHISTCVFKDVLKTIMVKT